MKEKEEYMLIEDDHALQWCIIPISKLNDWWEWYNRDEDNYPNYVEEIDDLSNIKFKEYRVEKKNKEK